MSLLSYNNVNVAFGDSKAVKGVSFEVERGEVVALVGESGSGKSVTALSSVNLLPETAELSGSVRYKGQELVGASEDELRALRGNEISFIFQEPMTSLNPLHTLEKQLSEVLLIHHGITGLEARLRVIELLEQVGIVDPETRLADYPHQLSGGQRQRVMIAMALANNPEILIADEPTTALDVTIQAQILHLLQSLKDRLGMAMLFITHDLTIVRQFADRVCVMKDGEIVESGRTQDVFANPQHEYTRMLIGAEPTGAPAPVPANAEVIAKTEDLRIWFPIQRGFLKRTVGHVKAVNAAQFEIREGETIGVVGESGSGKTTLALAMMRLISSEGPVVVLGKDLQGWTNRQLRDMRRDMQIVFQDPYGSLSPRMTVTQIIAEGLGIHGLGDYTSEDEAVIEIMEEVGLDPETRHRYPHEFSGGQRQRIAIARAMILRPRFVVLDEPTSALDMTVQVQIVALLRELQEKHRLAYLFISHDLRVVRSLSHKVLVMKQGVVIETGTADQIFEAPKEDYTKTLVSAALDLKI